LQENIENQEKSPYSFRIRGLPMARREGFEPPAFWSVVSRGVFRGNLRFSFFYCNIIKSGLYSEKSVTILEVLQSNRL